MDATLLEYISMMLLIIGIILLIIEIFIPSFGIWGGLGIVATIAGIILFADTLVEGIIILLLVTCLLSIIIYFSVKWIAKKNKTLILKESLGEDNKIYDDLKFFIGKKGITTTALRPSGNADFDGVKLDVLSKGDFIKSGKQVEVVEIQGTKIIVKEYVNERIS
ncbi:NfeD family protein [Vallitalea okinawensis]|uniref:NfeD family protein n=1 Tax=Vallitalea okinawensis TaxID=2078660 RepID=UPI001300B248|nr:NfeD family protein [Vallitalea okinawensis]